MKKFISIILIVIMVVSAYSVNVLAQDYVKMYAPDGRTRETLKSEVEAYKKVGWYIEPVVKMYAPDGRTRYTLKSEVEAYKKVGWYIEPVVKMYAADGRTRYTLKSEVEAYKKVGWYTYLPSKETIKFFEGTWGNQGMTMSITHLNGNLFKIEIDIPDTVVEYPGYYSYNWNVTAELDSNNVFTYKNGTYFYWHYRLAVNESNNESGTIRFIKGDPRYIDDWDCLDWRVLNTSKSHNITGMTFYK